MGLFKPAVKHEAKLRLAISGPSGSGKTYTSLALATALAGGKPVALVDTEHGSAAKYADTFNFDVLEMTPPFHPDRFGEAIREAAKAGYGVIVLDSLTHAWSGSGGMLDLIDEIAKRKSGGNTFAAWKEGTPIQNRLIDSIVGAGIHVIATMRSKQDFVQDKDDKGKTVIRKVGMAAQQREGFEYEFDVVLDMDIDNNAVVAKTRAPALNGRVFPKPGKELAGLLLEWLKGAPSEPVKAVTVVTGPVKPELREGVGEQQGVLATDQVPPLEAARKAFHAQGTAVFGGEWDKARRWLLMRYTTNKTPDDVRVSTHDMTLDELRDLRTSLDKWGVKLVQQFADYKAEQDAAATEAIAKLNETAPGDKDVNFYPEAEREPAIPL